jgi:hypothetical protein
VVTADVEPPEPGLWEAAGELLAALLPAALPELDAPPHPARTNPAATMTTALRPLDGTG